MLTQTNPTTQAQDNYQPVRFLGDISVTLNAQTHPDFNHSDLSLIIDGLIYYRNAQQIELKGELDATIRSAKEDGSFDRLEESADTGHIAGIIDRINRLNTHITILAHDMHHVYHTAFETAFEGE